MRYTTQITVNDKLIIFKRDWTTEERLRFERIVCAMFSNPDIDMRTDEIFKYSFAQMVMLDDFYKQTQQTSHE